jgi:hypothetical protein
MHENSSTRPAQEGSNFSYFLAAAGTTSELLVLLAMVSLVTHSFDPASTQVVLAHL